MHGILKTAFETFALLSSAVQAIPSSRSVNLVQVQEDVLSTPERLSEDIHIAEEFSVALMFDEIVTEGNYIWADGYGNLEWSPNHYVFNQSEQHLFPRNHASSAPNLLFVQDSSHSGGAEPYFQVRENSPAESFDLHGISILPYTASPKAPILFSIRGYPSNGGDPYVLWYKWTWDAQLEYPWVAAVEGIDFVKKVEIFVVPGTDTSSEKRLPFTLDNIKITWRNLPTGAVKAASKDIGIIENQQGSHQGL